MASDDQEGADIDSETARESKRVKMSEEGSSNGYSQRNVMESARKEKNEKEKDRRDHLNGLFCELGDLLGIPGHNKADILANAKRYLEKSYTSTRKSG